MKIFVRADGGMSIGMGHVMRMLVLASELRKRRNQVIFLCKNSKGHKYDAGIQKIKNYDFEVIGIEENNIIESIIKIQKENIADILISDTYEVDEEYFNKLKPYFKLTGYVDDVNKCYMDVDFIINQNINAEKLDYSKTTKEDTNLFLGPQYCMIREEFKIAHKKKEPKEFVEDVLLTVGGMDDSNNTIKILRKLKMLKQRIHVVLGNAFSKSVIDEVCKFSEEYKNIYLYENANMSELMKICDIAVSACGSTIYELSAMQIPAIGIIIADNQKDVAKLMKEKKIILDAIDVEQLESDKILELVRLLIDNSILRQEIKNNSNGIINLYGVEKLAESIGRLYKF